MPITLLLREGPAGKGAPLTNEEVDSNFINLRQGIYDESAARQDVADATEVLADRVDVVEGSLETINTTLSSVSGSVTGKVSVSGDEMTGDLILKSSLGESPSLSFDISGDGVTAKVFYYSIDEGFDPQGKSYTNIVNRVTSQVGFRVEKHSVEEGSTDIFYVNDNVIQYKTNAIWHSGNDGEASGLNADLLDGKHANEFAPSTHNHNDLYYTKSESDTTFASLVHDHNDLYYTKIQSDDLFASLVHNHDDLYYTKSESDTTFAPVVHSHNYQPLSETLDSISSFDSNLDAGYLKRVVVDGVASWELDSSISSNESVYTNGSVSTFMQNTPGGNAITLDQFSISTFRSVKYMIQATAEGEFHVTEVLILQNGADAFITEFGTLNSNGPLITVTPQVDSVSGMFSVIVTPTSSVNTIIKAMRYSLFV